MTVVLPLPAAVALIAALVFVAQYLYEDLPWLPAPTLRPPFNDAVTVELPPSQALLLPTEPTTPVIPGGRHRLENARTPYRLMTWNEMAHTNIGARPYVTAGLIEMQQEERPTVELTPVA